MPLFSRRHQGVILLLGAALLLLYAWRAHFWRPFPPPAAAPQNLIFVEVAGAVAHAGVFSFTTPPTLPQLWQLTGAPGNPPPPGPALPSGTRVEVDKDGKYRLGSMSGTQLLTLGLPLDLNRATAADLEALPGIGPELARRIIDYRTAHGPFKRIDDLEEVSGIGSKKVEKIKPYIIIVGPVASPPNQQK
jgi:competence protein ComEA